MSKDTPERLSGFQIRMLAHLQREIQLMTDAATWGFSVVGPDGERIDPQDVIGTNAGPPMPASGTPGGGERNDDV